MESPAASSSRPYFPASFHDLLASRRGRFLILVMAACFSLPSFFAIRPDVGLDPSWLLSLQLAFADGKAFGREYVFTYGPLGWLLMHIPLSKLSLLLYDLFIMGNVLTIYNDLLPARPRPLDAILVIALAIVTKLCLFDGSSAVLFTILCYWLWRACERGDKLAVICSLASAVVLFFGKVNYGFLMIFLMSSYGLGLMILFKDRRLTGFLLLTAFPLLTIIGAAIWHVDLQSYLRSGFELIAGYNDAMFVHPMIYSLSLELAVLFLLAMVFVAFCGRHSLTRAKQAMILPLVALAGLLLFKNGFLRSDEGHNQSFQEGLPLLLAFLCIACRSHKGVKLLLLASIIYPISVLLGRSEKFGRTELVSSIPLRYLSQAIKMPWHQSHKELQSILEKQYPEAVLHDDVRAIIGRSSVDVMPWESSIAVLNGLILKQRPVTQSYSVYTPWLDNLNAHFLSSPQAPEFVLYACSQESSIDGRPSAWDESITKRALLENYVFTSQFTMPLRFEPPDKLEAAPVFILKHEPGASLLILVSSNEVTMTLDQKLPLPATTNLLFLTLNVGQTFLGRMRGFALSPSLLTTTFEYQDGSSKDYRAVLPILRTGVLVNRRVESSDEIRNWLQHAAEQNMAVSSISFKSTSPWAFKPELNGSLVEYRIVQKTNTAMLQPPGSRKRLF